MMESSGSETGPHETPPSQLFSIQSDNPHHHSLGELEGAGNGPSGEGQSLLCTSMRDDLLRAHPPQDFSYSLNKDRSADYVEKRIQSFILADRSNPELRNSCSSKYLDYLDQFKKSFLQLIHEDDEHSEESADGDSLLLSKHFKNSGSKDNLKGRQNSQNLNNLNASNILLNSTILSNCFGNISFNHNPNISKEVDFTEEDPLDDSCSFLSKLKVGEAAKPLERSNPNPFSIIDEIDESFSFCLGFNNKVSRILHELDTMDPRVEHSEDSICIALEKERALFTQKAIEPRDFPKEAPGPDQEQVEITIKFLKDGLPKKSYTLTRRGLVGSTKNTRTNFLVIGRMEEDQSGMRPNDIVLATEDKTVSRMHACLVYRYGFHQRRIPTRFLVFLSGKDPKIGGESCKVQKIPYSCIKIIYQYLKQDHKFYIADLGSVSGTYKKLVYPKMHTLKKRDLILIGSETQLLVREVRSGISYTPDEAFYNLISEENKETTEIIGLEPEQMKKIEEKRKIKENAISQILNENYESFDKNLQNSQEPAKIPMLIIEVRNSPSHVKKKQILVCLQKEKTFSVGRVPENDVFINAFMISRKHCRIVYKDGIWYFVDGTETKKSLNGSWLAIQGLQQGTRMNSQGPTIVEDQDEIKISESILTFSIKNGPKKHQTQNS